MSFSKERILRAAGGVVAAALAVWALAAFFNAGANEARAIHVFVLSMLLQRAGLVLFAAIVALAAISFGTAILRVLGVGARMQLSFILEASAVGLGAFALIFLGLGVLGVMHRVVWLAAVVAGAAAGAPTWVGLMGKREAGGEGGLPWPETAFVLLAGFVLVLAVLMGFHPPLDYDVQEYHLGAPAMWLRMGQIRYLPGNVYSNFPLNAEMLFQGAMVVLDWKGKADAYPGSYGAISIVMLFAILTALALGDVASRLAGRRAGVLAVVFFLTCRWTFDVSIKAYVEMPLVFFSILAVDRIVRSVLDSAREEAGRDLLVGGLCLGLAMGTKYTAWAYFAAPLGVFLLAAAALGKVRFRHVVVCGVAALAAVAPWLVRNLINTGNPVFPMLAGTLGAGPWDPAQVARWNWAHRPTNAFFVQRFREVFFNDIKLSPLMYLFVPAGVFLAARRKMVIAFTLLATYAFGVWVYATHHMPRFLLPAMALLCVVSAAGCAGIAGRRRYAGAALTVAFLLALFGVVNIYASVLLYHQETFRGSDPELDLGSPSVFERSVACRDVFAQERALATPESRMLYLGEARFFYMGAHSEVRTVFDGNFIDEVMGDGVTDDAAIVAELKRRNIRFVLVNWPEILRLNRDYAFEFGGETRPGYSARISRDLFARWRSKDLIASVDIGRRGTGDPFEMFAIK